MATIGQVLTTPENGYQRIDDNHDKIKYTETLQFYDDRNSNYNKTVHYMKANSGIVEFTFKGTKVAFIGDVINSTGISNNIEVYIDEVLQGVYTQRLGSSSWSYQAVWFTKTGLDNKIHTVKIVNKGAQYFTLDAIDIDINGYFGSINKILLLQNENTYSILNGLMSSESSIPIMTSYTTPSGIVKTSSDYTSFEAWKAFDRSNTTRWATNNGAIGWISYEYNDVKKIYKYEITPPTSNLLLSPKDWTFEGSNDGIAWTVIDIQTNQVGWVDNVKRTYDINKPSNYKVYRLNISANNGSSARTSLSELIMYESFDAKVIQIPSQSEQILIKYGIDSPVQVDEIFSSKNYILQDTISEDINGLWSTQINRKPLSIKFD